MALVNFSNLDFDQIKTQVKSYLRTNSDFTDFDFDLVVVESHNCNVQ